MDVGEVVRTQQHGLPAADSGLVEVSRPSDELKAKLQDYP